MDAVSEYLVQENKGEKMQVKYHERADSNDIKNFYSHVKESVANAEVATYLETCVRCGLCAEACHYYLAENISGNPRPDLVPAHKGDLLRKIYYENYTFLGKIKKFLGFGVKITPQDLKEQSMLAYDTCSNCDRCSRVCPMGIHTPTLTAILRGALTKASQLPPDLVEPINNAINVNNPMGIDVPHYIGLIEKISKEHNVQIPIDKPDSEYVLIYTALDEGVYNDNIVNEAKILNKAGVNWTVSTIAREGSNFGIFAGSKEIQKEIAKRVLEGARAVGAKKIIISECGHGYWANRFVAPNLIEDWDLEAYQMVEVIYKLIKDKKLTIKRKVLHEVATFHDGCQIGRRSGVIKEAREIINMLTDYYKESSGSAEKSFCCGGGGGIVLNKRAHDYMEKAFLLKIEQFDKVEAKHVITECVNCEFVIDNDIKSYNRGYQKHSISSLVVKAIEDEKEGEE